MTVRLRELRPEDVDHLRDWDHRAVVDPSRHAMVIESAGALAGGVEVSVDSDAHHRGELAYYVLPEHRGHGIATEAVRLMVRYAFAEIGLHRVWAVCDPDNEASRRVLERAGFVYEGRLRDDMLVDGRWRDSLIYAVLAGAER